MLIHCYSDSIMLENLILTSAIVRDIAIIKSLC